MTVLAMYIFEIWWEFENLAWWIVEFKPTALSQIHVRFNLFSLIIILVNTYAKGQNSSRRFHRRQMQTSWAHVSLLSCVHRLYLNCNGLPYGISESTGNTITGIYIYIYIYIYIHTHARTHARTHTHIDTHTHTHNGDV